MGNQLPVYLALPLQLWEFARYTTPLLTLTCANGTLGDATAAGWLAQQYRGAWLFASTLLGGQLHVISARQEGAARQACASFLLLLLLACLVPPLVVIYVIERSDKRHYLAKSMGQAAAQQTAAGWARLVFFTTLVAWQLAVAVWVVLLSVGGVCTQCTGAR